MTETTKTVLDKYQVRKSKKQKNTFIEYVSSVSNKLGYVCKTERGQLGANNIIVGDVDKAKIVYTAHYDTCARFPIPNFIAPKNIFAQLVYMLILVICMEIIFFCTGFITTLIASQLFNEPVILSICFRISGSITLIVILLLMFFGPANQHTANDNTSGVTTLLDIMQALPIEYRDNVAFIFFDLEEPGLFGSSGYRKKHKKETNEQLIINFDCVSDGEHMIFVLKRKARDYAHILKEAFKSNENINVEVLTKGAFYPSDQINFPKGVGVAALNKSKLFGFLYLGRIHTKRDTVYREENIAFLVDGAVKLAEMI